MSNGRGVPQKLRTMFGTTLGDLNGQLENVGKQRVVIYLGGEPGYSMKGLERYRARENKLAGTDLKNIRAGICRYASQTGSTLREKIHAEVDISHCQPPAKFTPQPEFICREDNRRRRNGLDELTADTKRHARERGT